MNTPTKMLKEYLHDKPKEQWTEGEEDKKL
jgi:hypothetical protein